MAQVETLSRPNPVLMVLEDCLLYTSYGPSQKCSDFHYLVGNRGEADIRSD